MKVAVIGAGTSGLICAYKLRKRGFDVFLFDKNEKVGRKIYITGKGIVIILLLSLWMIISAADILPLPLWVVLCFLLPLDRIYLLAS